MKSRRTNFSRRAHFEEKKSRQQIVVIFLVLIAIFAGIFFVGIPFLIKMSALLGDLRGGDQITTTTTRAAPLFPPTLEPLPEATNSAQITVKGSAQSGLNVEIILNNESVKKIVADSDGNFIASGITLKDGENSLRAQASNDSEKSGLSQTYFIIYKKSAPSLEVSEPNDGANLSGDNKEVKIVGKTDLQVTATVNDRWVIVNSDGSFNTSYLLSSGENILKIVARDAAGNETTLERKVTYNP